MGSPPLYLIGSFLAFAEAKTMAEAAIRLGLSQPAITHHLQVFESYFPQKVFTMVGRKKVLTNFGIELCELLQGKFGGLNSDIKTLNDRYQEPRDVILRVTGRAEVLNHIAADVKFPGQVIFVPNDGASAVEGLLERRFDLAISNHISRAGSLVARKFFTDGFSIVVPKKWDVKSPISASMLKELLKEPYLSYKEEDPQLRALLKHFKIDEWPKFSKVLSDWPTLIRMAGQGQGWTVAPQLYLNVSDKVSSVEPPVGVIPEVDFFLFYRKESSTMPWFRKMVMEFRQT